MPKCAHPTPTIFVMEGNATRAQLTFGEMIPFACPALLSCPVLIGTPEHPQELRGKLHLSDHGGFRT